MADSPGKWPHLFFLLFDIGTSLSSGRELWLLSTRLQHLFPGSAGQMSRLNAKSRVCCLQFCPSFMTLALQYPNISSLPSPQHHEKTKISSKFSVLKSGLKLLCPRHSGMGDAPEDHAAKICPLLWDLQMFMQGRKISILLSSARVTWRSLFYCK